LYIRGHAYRPVDFGAGGTTWPIQSVAPLATAISTARRNAGREADEKSVATRMLRIRLITDAPSFEA
jgi:hypothetical protein